MAAQLGALDQIGKNRRLVEDLPGEPRVFEVIMRQGRFIRGVELIDRCDLLSPTLAHQLALSQHLRGDEI